MHDPPRGQVAAVERLLQVLAVLRSAEDGVPRPALVAAVQAYAADEAAAEGLTGAEKEKATAALNKKMGNDRKKLVELGFDVTDQGEEGEESVFLLRPTPWRVPLDLTQQEQAVLSWVLRAAGAEVEGTVDEQTVPEALRHRSYEAVLGTLPPALGQTHVALAGRRRLVIDRDGEEVEIEPVQLASHDGRWYLLARYPGTSHVYGYRLDRLQVTGVGERMDVVPERVADPVTVLDPAAWRRHEPVDVVLRCSAEDEQLVASWFPRAARTQEGPEVVLTFPATNGEAVLDRVLGLAGAARLVAPPSLVGDLRARLLPFVEGAA